ncbi:MAG TPA: hypothetical protein VL992_02290 [Tepidisphaeraceae bacterium]|nr:hypothetical protein [Tepidisphaeraceae bacterium]
MRKSLCTAAAAVVAMACASVALGHGFVGDRFFPPTIATDDPFAVDELTGPVVSEFKQPGTPAVWETDTDFEFDKEILPHFMLGLNDDSIYDKPSGQPGAGGWDNFTVIGKYELWHNDEHEAIITAGMQTVFGGTGTSNVAGHKNFNTYEPTLYFGKGFGDLPDSLPMLKPFAVTGVLDNTFPNKDYDDNQFQWGFAIEYSLPYLEDEVEDTGLPRPFRDMIPLVEISMDTNENRSESGQTTGSIYPGVLWETPYFQVGLEAIVPVNGHTGPHVGAILDFELYIDDLFPQIFGHPLFFGGQNE